MSSIGSCEVDEKQVNKTELGCEGNQLLLRVVDAYGVRGFPQRNAKTEHPSPALLITCKLCLGI